MAGFQHRSPNTPGREDPPRIDTAPSASSTSPQPTLQWALALTTGFLSAFSAPDNNIGQSLPLSPKTVLVALLEP